MKQLLVIIAILLFASPAQAAFTRTARGSGNHNTGATTLVITPASNFTANSFGVLCVAVDNAGASGSTAIAPATVTDSASNVWTLRQSSIYDPGAASAGVETAIYTAPVATLTTGGNITITWGGSTSPVAKAWTLDEFTVAAGKVAQFVTSGVGTGAASGTPTVTTGSITNADAVIGAGGAESANTWAGDADTTNGSWSTHQSNAAGTGNSGMSITSQTKIVTATATQTYNPTLTSADQILAWVQIREVTAPSSGFFFFFRP